MKYYYSKILLFGEYVILLNANALSVPLHKFKGRLNYISANRNDTSIKSNSVLHKFLYYIKEKQNISLKLKDIEHDIGKGLFFESDIPENSGLGSSGAVIAAIFDKYSIFKNKLDLQILKNKLSQLESFFHSYSSGLDPLVSYLNSPILFKNQVISIADIISKNNNIKLFLIDSRQKRNTNELVNHFKNEYQKDSIFQFKIDTEYIIENNRCINSYISNNISAFFEHIKQLSGLQLELFDRMIPEDIKNHFRIGLCTGQFYLKLCGSGGGGYFLGFTNDLADIKSYFTKKGYSIFIL